MRVKICGIQNEAELETAVKAGADAVGFQVGQVYASQSFILPSTARRLAENLPVFITPVLVTHLNTAEAIFELLDHAEIYAVQLTDCQVDEVAKLRDKLPAAGKIIYTEYVHEQINEMKMAELLPLIDAINLDCYNLASNLVGVDSPNKCYAWGAGAEYVKRAALPVILSGRLNAVNAAEAIAAVRPYAVDACTQLKNADGVLDPAVSANFIWECKKSFFTINHRGNENA